MNNPFIIAAYGNYDVRIEQNLHAFNSYLKNTNYSKYFVLVDENTAAHCLPILQNEIKDVELNIIEIKSGEQHKNFETLQYIIQQLITHQADRKALLINLGGGVICDMGAFAASIYKRGIHFIQLPTTLLAMVDASVGGKTGINFNSYKNQVGTFTNPKLVYANSNFLKTLPKRQLKNGLAEMLKHGFLSGNLLSSEMVNDALAINSELQNHVFQSVNFKNEIVTLDFNEKADRKQLNYGHTIGHAIESYSLKNDGVQALLHGEAIATGFIIEALLSAKKYNDDLIELMLHDKKNNANNIQFALLEKIGQPVWDVSISEQEIKNAFNLYNQLIENAV